MKLGIKLRDQKKLLELCARIRQLFRLVSAGIAAKFTNYFLLKYSTDSSKIKILVKFHTK